MGAGQGQPHRLMYSNAVLHGKQGDTTVKDATHNAWPSYMRAVQAADSGCIGHLALCLPAACGPTG